MFDNIDKKEISRLFFILAVFIVIAYFFGKWLAGPESGGHSDRAKPDMT